jgi:hypothetical protein
MDFTKASRQDAESFITLVSFLPYKLKYTFARYRRPSLTKRIRGDEREKNGKQDHHRHQET